MNVTATLVKMAVHARTPSTCIRAAAFQDTREFGAKRVSIPLFSYCTWIMGTINHNMLCHIVILSSDHFTGGYWTFTSNGSCGPSKMYSCNRGAELSCSCWYPDKGFMFGSPGLTFEIRINIPVLSPMWGSTLYGVLDVRTWVSFGAFLSRNSIWLDWFALFQTRP